METNEIKTPKKRGRKPGSKGHCSYCGAVGHYKKTCPKYLREVKEEDRESLVEVNLRVGVDPDDR